MTIDILMATYNGANYIESQILSLLAQTYKNWELIIHDDGSSDNTLEIVNKYIGIDSRIKLITDGVICGGAAKNFLHLLKFSTSEYIIFCDQDDVWFENKLDVLYTNLISKEKYNSKPQAYFVSGYLYNSSQGINGVIPSLHPRSLNDVLFLSAGLQGCSLMFNKQVRDIINKFEGYSVMHDHILLLALICFGEVHYSDSKLMLYRQNHSGKVTASVETNKFRKILNVFQNKFPVIDNSHSKANLSFYNFFKTELDANQINLFEQYFLFQRTNSLFKRLKIVIDNRFNIGGSVFLLCIKTVLRPVKN